MAWKSSGSTNEEMAMALKGHGIIKSDQVLKAFRSVDRAHFVPRQQVSQAYKDSPVTNGVVHLSAPHIYAQVMETLELAPGMSFLNIGSGSGYLSCLVGNITGKEAINHGLEINPAVVDACKESVYSYLLEQCCPEGSNQDDDLSSLEDDNMGANQEDIDQAIKKLRRQANVGVCDAVCGDAFSMETVKNMKYDRIYVGGGAPLSLIETVKELLNPFGIAVGPFKSQLMKIRRRDGDQFSQLVLTHVQFAAMRESDANNVDRVCYFPHQGKILWTPDDHIQYPKRFKNAISALVLAESHLPVTLWMRVFEFCRHDWFNRELNETEKLQVLLEIETNAREEAERRAEKAEHDLHKSNLLLWRQQNQIQLLMARLRRENNDVEDVEDDDEDDMSA
ncbi:unnamed protein product [Aphanomyces euteiches]|nr:hypothetical protein AeRB84_011102 [Aphanomyces euteiches]